MPARRDARRNRARLLHAAAEVFAERGVDAPVNAIAERAGVTKVTLYRHFRSKDELLLAIMADHYDRLADVADELAGSGLSPQAALEAYMERAALQIAPDRAYFHVALMAGAESEAVRVSAGRLHLAVGRLLEAAQAQGGVRADLDAGDIHSLLLGLTSSFSRAAGDSELWRRYLSLLLDGLEPAGTVVAEPPMRFEEYGLIPAERARRRRARRG
jgi:AcrR family transcriptional regulator